MSDWCAWMETKLLKCKKILIDDREVDDEEFHRIMFQLHRMRYGTWKEGQI